MVGFAQRIKFLRNVRIRACQVIWKMYVFRDSVTGYYF